MNIDTLLLDQIRKLTTALGLENLPLSSVPTARSSACARRAHQRARRRMLQEHLCLPAARARRLRSATGVLAFAASTGRVRLPVAVATTITRLRRVAVESLRAAHAMRCAILRDRALVRWLAIVRSARTLGTRVRACRSAPRSRFSVVLRTPPCALCATPSAA